VVGTQIHFLIFYTYFIDIVIVQIKLKQILIETFALDHHTSYVVVAMLSR